MEGLVEGLNPGTTDLAFDARTRLAYTAYTSGVVSTLERIGVATSMNGQDSFTYDLFLASNLALQGLDADAETRAIAFFPDAPNALPQAFVVSHFPDALLSVDVTNTDQTFAYVDHTTKLGADASRMTLGYIEGHPIALVSCFDSRQLFVIDADSGEPVSVVFNFSGPFEVALDEKRERLYVADFRSSVIRIVDLSPVFAPAGETTTARVVATLGGAKVIQELK
jgi:hypothetical protein